MPFVNEKIPEEFMKAIDFDVFRGFGGSSPRISGYWTRDEACNVFLISTDAGGGKHVDAPREEKHGLWWNGDVVHFSGSPIATQDVDGWVRTWEDTFIDIPPHLMSRRTEFVSMVKEALIANGTKTSVHPDYNRKVVINLE